MPITWFFICLYLKFKWRKALRDLLFYRGKSVTEACVLLYFVLKMALNGPSVINELRAAEKMATLKRVSYRKSRYNSITVKE